MPTIQVYSIDELSEKAKDRARWEYASLHGYDWIEESLDSVKEFCKQFGVVVTNYELSTTSYSYIATDAKNSNFRNLVKNFILVEFPTGYCVDEDLRITYLDNFKATGSAKKAFDAAIGAAVKSIVTDMEYQDSLEYFIDIAEANNYQFLADGRMI